MGRVGVERGEEVDLASVQVLGFIHGDESEVLHPGRGLPTLEHLGAARDAHIEVERRGAALEVDQDPPGQRVKGVEARRGCPVLGK